MTSAALPIPHEHAEQVRFITDFRYLYPGVLIFAIPNGGHRNEIIGGKLKAEGVVAGILDMQVPAWRLWIEMKRQRGGSVSEDQKAVIEYLTAIGDRVIVAKGAADALEQVIELVNRAPELAPRSVTFSPPVKPDYRQRTRKRRRRNSP